MRGKIYLSRWLISLFGLVFFVALPAISHAAPPPGGVRWWWFTGAPPTNLDQVLTYFHVPEDVNKESNFMKLNYGNPPSSQQITTYDVSAPVKSGQPIAVTSLLWLDPQAGPLTGTRVDAVQLQQSIPYEGENGCSESNPNWPSPKQGQRLFPSNFIFGQKGNFYVASGQTVENNNSGRPDVYLTTTYIAPVVTKETNFCVTARAYYSADSAEPTPGVSVVRLVKVIPDQQRVEVKSGSVAVRDQIGSKFVPADTTGQTLVTTQNTVSCAWVATGSSTNCDNTKLRTFGSYNLKNYSTANRTFAWSALTKSMSTLARTQARLTATGSSSKLNEEIDQFLNEPVDPWSSSRGKVLVVGAYGDITVDRPGGAFSSAFYGKKIIIFPNANSVTWQRDVVAPKALSSSNKFVSITFADNSQQNLAKTTYDGAFISKGTINVTGSGGTQTITGLLAADKINFNRTITTGEQLIATINYDPSFQDGTVAGLAPFVIPLVSEGSAR